MSTERALIDLAHEGHDAAALRELLLARLCSALEAEVGLFVAIEDGREVRALRGLPAETVTRLDADWGRLRVEAKVMTAHALVDGATTDVRSLGAELERTLTFRRIMAPLGGTETLYLVPTLGAEPLGMLALGRLGGRFTRSAVAHARSLIPAVSVAYRAAAARPRSPLALTPSEVDLLDYLELGWGTREIARARGTSFFTVRNQLSALYRRLDVANRAEAIGLRRGRPRGR